MEKILKTDNAHTWADKINNNFEELSGGVASNPIETDIFIGPLAQNGVWVSQKNIVCPVENAATVKFHLPKGMGAKVEHGTDRSPNVSSSILYDGDTFTFPSGANTQKISFATISNGTAVQTLLAYVESLVALGSIRVTREDYDVIIHNTNKEDILVAVKRVKTSESTNANVDVSPQIAHISDLHGDAQRAYNFFKYCKYAGIDDCVVTGDATLYSGEGIDYVFDAANKVGIHVTFAMGNHEAYVTESAGAMFDKYLANYAEDLNYLVSANQVTNRGYYYYDIPSKSLRIIVLDQYDGGVYGGQNKGGRISQGQIDFFVSVLKSTSVGYGVVVAMHSQEDQIDRPDNFSKFNSENQTSYAALGFYVDSSRPIKNIIDAFIGRTSYTGGYTLTYLGETENITINADFSDVDSTIDFICYLTGHIHRDAIGYVHDTTHKQLIITVPSGNALAVGTGSSYAFSGGNDLPRRGWGVTQDAFNVYSIDRENKTVRIMRVGSDLTYTFNKRDYMVAPYADTE